ncbi:hypothetical protein WBG06_18830 [Nocardioides sp. CCNWLW239]
MAMLASAAEASPGLLPPVWVMLATELIVMADAGSSALDTLRE